MQEKWKPSAVEVGMIASDERSAEIRRNTQANKPQANKPYGIQEVFEVFKVSAEYPVRLGMQIAFGRVRRKTEPTGPGTKAIIISKIDTYGSVRKPNLPGR